jgi:hypothetical protein
MYRRLTFNLQLGGVHWLSFQEGPIISWNMAGIFHCNFIFKYYYYYCKNCLDCKKIPIMYIICDISLFKSGICAFRK